MYCMGHEDLDRRKVSQRDAAPNVVKSVRNNGLNDDNRVFEKHAACRDARVCFQRDALRTVDVVRR